VDITGGVLRGLQATAPTPAAGAPAPAPAKPAAKP
jgi:hypothetical protein